LEIRRTPAFETWITGLRDRRGRAKIVARIDRLAFGNAGDVAPVGQGVSELRLHFGPGYRVYFLRRGTTVVVLLGGGDKATQKRDIAAALEVAANLEDE
jgi:putative addiction module killer protein